MLELKSFAFPNGGSIPKIYTQEGDNSSPPLQWTDASPSTQEFAMICEDPDAPKNAPYIHWVIYGIPAHDRAIAMGQPPVEKLESPTIATQGTNSAGKLGYTGPMPPVGSGSHRYYFRLFALDKKLELEPGLTKDELFDRMRTNVIAEAEFMGRYERTASIEANP